MTSITGNSYIDGLTHVAQNTTTPAEAKKNNTLGQEAFLKLMTTQLKTQDPFAPVDNQQMVAQMAQFSSVAGISEMNTSLKGIATDLAASRMGDASSWIGRTALVESDVAAPMKDGNYKGTVALAKKADEVAITFYDTEGKAVHQLDLGKLPAGSTDFEWDGKDGSGKAVPGPLKLSVVAKNSAGSVESATGVWTNVTGVQSPAGGSAARLVTALGLVNPADTLSLL